MTYGFHNVEVFHDGGERIFSNGVKTKARFKRVQGGRGQEGSEMMSRNNSLTDFCFKGGGNQMVAGRTCGFNTFTYFFNERSYRLLLSSSA